jgi:hypothetical protein
VSIKVKLYGKLRDLATDLDEKSGTVGIIEINEREVNTVLDVLERLGLSESDISHVFVNNGYSSSTRDLPGDARLALFPEDMGLLYHWYFEEEG